MLLQTNSYVVPKQHRAEHARLLGRFRQALARVGCDQFEVYQQADANWDPNESEGRFVQILRFRDREHQQDVRAAERMDLEAQSLIEEFCRIINFPYQQEHGLFAVGFYTELTDEPVEFPVQSEPEVKAAVQQTARVDAEPDSIKLGPSDSPPAEEELDHLLSEQFEPTPPRGASGSQESELSRVLDAGLALDELDIPMEAELLDEAEPDEAKGPAARRGSSLSHE